MSVSSRQSAGKNREISEATQRMAKILGAEFQREARWDTRVAEKIIQKVRA